MRRPSFLDVRFGLSKLTSQLGIDQIAGVFCSHVTLLTRGRLALIRGGFSWLAWTLVTLLFS